MGCKGSKVDHTRERGAAIDEKIKADASKARDEIKLLVLGTGESGKSTFVKQLQILYTEGFDDKTKHLFKKVIHTNLVKHTKALIEAARELGLQFDGSTDDLADEFLDAEIEKCDHTTPDVIETIQELWDDSALKEAFELRSLFQIPDSTGFYLDEINRVTKEHFTPTDQDILGCRIPTTGIKELSFNIANYSWQIIDVGGQRSERRKWLHQFDDVTAILYIVAVSEYNQKLYEDDEINRMHESLELFDTTANHKLFGKVNCIMMFNKIDIFQEKIKKHDLNVCFPDYEDGLDYDLALEYIKEQFESKGRRNDRRIFSYFTCATDTDNIRNAFEKFREQVLQDHLSKLGVIED